MFVTKGAFLDCALETAISSDLAGMTSCRLTRDVYSTSGKVLLIERGSKIVGEYQSGLQKGKARIFVLWSRIETPTGVIVKLDSAGTGPLGRSGHSGFIDTHFWERFGSAILLSLIDDVVLSRGLFVGLLNAKCLYVRLALFEQTFLLSVFFALVSLLFPHYLLWVGGEEGEPLW
jgi:hypothetical protein